MDLVLVRNLFFLGRAEAGAARALSLEIILIGRH